MYSLGPEAEVLHRRYAQALIDIAEADKKLDDMKESLEMITAVLEKEPLLQKTICHPSIDKKEKIKLLEALTKKTKCCDEFLWFLKTLLKNDRFKLIHGVYLKYRDLYNVKRRRQRVIVKSAISLGKEQLACLGKVLEKMLKKEILIEEILDKNIIGGFDLMIGDKVYNLSLLTRLQLAKEGLKR